MPVDHARIRCPDARHRGGIGYDRIGTRQPERMQRFKPAFVANEFPPVTVEKLLRLGFRPGVVRRTFLESPNEMTGVEPRTIKHPSGFGERSRSMMNSGIIVVRPVVAETSPPRQHSSVKMLVRHAAMRSSQNQVFIRRLPCFVLFSLNFGGSK